jgi:hypothetical protein
MPKSAMCCLMALRLSGLQMQKTLLVEQGFEFGR